MIAVKDLSLFFAVCIGVIAFADASKIEADDPVQCRGENYSGKYGSAPVVKLVDLIMTCDGYQHDETEFDAEEYTDEYGIDLYGDDYADNYGGNNGYNNNYGGNNGYNNNYGGNNGYNNNNYGGNNGYNNNNNYGNNGNNNGGRRNTRLLYSETFPERKLDTTSCYFGETATITGTIQVTGDIDSEMYVHLSASMFRLTKVLIDSINLCDLGDLEALDDGITCAEVGYYTFSKSFNIPDSDYAFMTTGFSGNIRAEISDEEGEELGCTKAALRSIQTEEDPPLTGLEIILLTFGIIFGCCCCTCILYRAGRDDQRLIEIKRKLPLVYHRGNHNDYGMYA